MKAVLQSALAQQAGFPYKWMFSYVGNPFTQIGMDAPHSKISAYLMCGPLTSYLKPLIGPNVIEIANGADSYALISDGAVMLGSNAGSGVLAPATFDFKAILKWDHSDIDWAFGWSLTVGYGDPVAGTKYYMSTNKFSLGYDWGPTQDVSWFRSNVSGIAQSSNANAAGGWTKTAFV